MAGRADGRAGLRRLFDRTVVHSGSTCGWRSGSPGGLGAWACSPARINAGRRDMVGLALAHVLHCDVVAELQLSIPLFLIDGLALSVIMTWLHLRTGADLHLSATAADDHVESRRWNTPLAPGSRSGPKWPAASVVVTRSSLLPQFEHGATCISPPEADPRPGPSPRPAGLTDSIPTRAAPRRWRLRWSRYGSLRYSIPTDCRSKCALTPRTACAKGRAGSTDGFSGYPEPLNAKTT